MTPTGTALLAAILANPDEDTPRLVYADWLEENGEPERAEFIRVQCELEPIRGLLSGPEWLACHLRRDWLIGRERKLWHQMPTARVLVPNGFKLVATVPHQPRFSFSKNGELPQIEGEFTRGFVSHVTCSWQDWRDHAATILAAHPVERVTLSSWPTLLHPDDRPNIAQALRYYWPRIEFELSSIMDSGLFDELDELECEQHMG